MSNSATPSKKAAFGSVFSDKMIVAEYKDGQWSPGKITDVAPLQLHPAAHVLHYASTCFEGMKAFKMANGEVKIFRLDRHIARMAQSASLLHLPIPSPQELESMIREVVETNKADIPEPPGALYLRPTLIGTEANIGAAGAPSGEALFYVLVSPVGDYFSGSTKGLTIAIEDQEMRSTPGFGKAKTGGNYASALRHVMRAKKENQADQVLFCPGGDVQETGAANFFLIDDNRIMTKPLDASFLHGVTRDSIINLARSMGYEIIEKDFTVDELLEWIQHGEAALSGTAAMLSGVGQFILHGETHPVGNGEVGPNTQKLREALLAIQSGKAEDQFAWLK
ncbi:Branched-chain-amino-acid transaminase [Saliniradius amylolyticus]|uniref:Branched-chain-amino-acid aminotransferase n=2 Tax=Saliniradius amylolyticus TaxID=2183582 RepID=A0A2S2E6M0_9ALTE|nr:Branched-chain-amino-acid transaminase [Saliniradius amylolyticus]